MTANNNGINDKDLDYVVPPKKKDLRKKELDVDAHEDKIHVDKIVTYAIRELQKLIGDRHAVYHTLQKYLDCKMYVKDTGVARLPYYTTRAPLSLEQTKDYCLMSVVCYLILEYWKYQQHLAGKVNIEKMVVYVNCLCRIPYREMHAEGTVRTGYYIWQDPTKQLDLS
jgi:hypothetical protein